MTCCAGNLVAITLFFSTELVNLFNSDGSALLETYASQGIRIYFVGFLFTAINIVNAGYFSATLRRRQLSVRRSVGGYPAFGQISAQEPGASH